MKLKTNDCKGLVYKGISNNYINSKGHIVEERRLIPQKRKSCPGCEHCYGLHEALDFLGEYEEVYFHNFEVIEHGELYYFGIFNVSRDYEGEVDCDCGFAKWEPYEESK